MIESKDLKFFIGYDDREKVAFYSCLESIVSQSSIPVSVTPLALSNLSDYTETHHDGSNQFIYSRFLVPYLSSFQGYSIFLDGDMIVRSDIRNLVELIDPSCAVQVVKHEYKTKFNTKYLGAKNEDYPKKNWSSVIIFNNSHELNKVLTPEFVQKQTGSYLHRFSWLDDELVGGLPLEWNWLITEYTDNTACNLAHFTLGTPCFENYQNQFLSDEWLSHRNEVVSHYE